MSWVLNGLARPCSALLAVLLAASTADGQAITGALLERGTGQPVGLGFITLLTVSGDSVTTTITRENGRFVVRSPVPGHFLLRASALGYRESTAGSFDLGTEATVDVEFRLDREAISLEGLEVLAERTGTRTQPALLRVGFYDRSQRGLGRFITPETIEKSTAISTVDLFFGIAGLTVQRNPFTGDQVLMRGTGGSCLPTLYVNGLQVTGAPIESIAPLQTVDAIEVYRRAVEVPMEYRSRGGGACGVILIWTKG